MRVKQYAEYNGKQLPLIKGGFGGGGGQGGNPTEEPNTLYSTDIMYLLNALGEGPVYRINPNGPLDIEITDSSIDDLITSTGVENPEFFQTSTTTGTTTQAVLNKFGDTSITPQQFASPVTLKKGNVNGIPKTQVLLQSTSANDWHELRFLFVINALQVQDNQGNVKQNSLTIKITVFDSTGSTEIKSVKKTVKGKTNTPYKFDLSVNIPVASRSTDGYKFTIEKTSNESTSSKNTAQIQAIGWFEIKNEPQAYPRTALIGYALKAFNEHQGGVPNFTSLVKGLLVKVPSNYNQPILQNGQIDWRELELPKTGTFGYTTNGYSLQKTDTGSHTSATQTSTESAVSFGAARADLVAGRTYNFTYDMGSISGTVGICIKGVDGVVRIFNGGQSQASAGGFLSEKDRIFSTPDGSTDFGISVRYECTGTAGMSQIRVPTTTGGTNTVKMHVFGTPNENVQISFLTHPSFNEDQVNTNQVPSVSPTGTQIVTAEVTVNDNIVTQTNANPLIYLGTWDGSFVYSWTQNPVWIVYDLLTNQTYGLGIPEDNIDKYKFFQIAQYCDAVDPQTGQFIGVDGLADGSFRHKPRGQFTAVKQTLVGIPEGTAIKERRFTTNMLIADQRQAVEHIQSICGSFRGALIQSFGKISLAVDKPEEYPSMTFNETNIQNGTFKISGNKESELITGVEASYIDPTNHYKREMIRIDSADANDGTPRATVENVMTLDLAGVTRRSQALRFAQYHIAASKFVKRVVSFTTSSEGLNLAPGDVISVSQNQTGINFGFGGKVSANASTSGDANVILEHFTQPTIAATTFTANTNPLALRVIQVENDRTDLYIVSNSSFTLDSTDNVATGSDLVEMKIIGRFNPITKNIDSVSSFAANNVPVRGDLWSFGEWVNTGDFYTNKAGKLFTVAELEREADGDVNVIAKEYVSNVYIDSDSFIDYTPTAYTDIESPYQAPPVPLFNLEKVVRRLVDGSIVFDAKIDNNTDRLGYIQTYRTEFLVSQPVATTLINNSHQSVLSLTVDNGAAIADAEGFGTLTGKAGFSSFLGEIRLLCNGFAQVDNGDGTSNVRLTLEGLNVAFDENIFKHILDVNDPGVFGGLKGDDFITVPLKEKASVNSLRNFIAFADDTVEVSANIVTFDKTEDTVDIENVLTGDLNIINVLPEAPFFVKINQLLDARFFDNSSFYVSGTEKTFTLSNTFGGAFVERQGGTTVEHIQLPIRPRDKKFIRFYVDGQEKSSGQFTFNKNSTVKSNLEYTVGSSDSEYRVEIDHYTVPAFEVGDNVQTFAGNVFTIQNTSFDPADASYNAALTANSIFRVNFVDRPTSNLFGSTLVNISENPEGTINNVSANTCTLDYDESVFPGRFNLANNGIYELQINSEYEKVFVDNDLLIRDLPEGTTSVKARNVNSFRRASAFAEKSITIEKPPIQKVTGLTLSESLYREQTGGVAIRVTCEFDHITGQEVTDYEISYKLTQIEDIGSNDGGAGLTSFNTVKVPSTGVEDDGKIRITVYGINRGLRQGGVPNDIIFRVTALNKDVRGVTSTITKQIVGKSAKPENIFNFTGGQQTDQITFFWEYVRNGDGDLFDLDLQEVVIRRLAGTHAATLANYIAASAFASVAAGVNRKSVPIDQFGTFTYLAKTRDTSGNESEDVVAITITTSRPQRSTVVAAFNEDSPQTNFTIITNTNDHETNYPSFANSNVGGVANTAVHSFDPSTVDNANGTSSGFSAVADADDLLADGSATYITQIRDFGSTVTGQVQLDIIGSQQIKTTYNDEFLTIYSSTTDASTSGRATDAAVGGLGRNLGSGNTLSLDFRFDANNKTLMSGSTAGNVYALKLTGNYTGNVIPISAVTKASPGVVTTSLAEHGIATTARVIVHDVEGMTQLNNREIFAKRATATTLELYTDSGATTALDTSGFGTFTSGGVLDQGDYANSNVIAFIAGTVDTGTVVLGNTFFANGVSTGGNTYANLSAAGTSYSLVDLKQYADATNITFEGDVGALSQQTFIRTTTQPNSILYFSDGTVNTAAFGSSGVNDEFVPYEAGTKIFRQFQIKFVVNNSEEDQYDFTLDQFRYTVEKEQTIFSNTLTYNNTTMTVDYANSNFLARPVISIQPIDTATAQTAIVTQGSNTEVSFRLFDIENDTATPTNQSIQVQITATGV